MWHNSRASFGLSSPQGAHRGPLSGMPGFLGARGVASLSCRLGAVSLPFRPAVGSQGVLFLVWLSSTAGRGHRRSPGRPAPTGLRRLPSPRARRVTAWGAEVPRQGRETCVGLRNFPLGLPLALWIFITRWGPVVSGSGDARGGTAAWFPETDSLSCISPPAPPLRDFLRGGGGILHSGVWALGATWTLFCPRAEASLGSQHFPGESTPVFSHSELFLMLLALEVFISCPG